MQDKIILLVEDNPDDVNLILRAFKKSHLTNQIVVVGDGAQALDYLFGTGEFADRDMRFMPQLVLLDLKLPKIDGIEVLRRIRENEGTKRLPVVALTSSNEQDDLVKCYNNGINSYIRKPVNFVDFVQAVQQLGLYWLVLNCAPE